jgi:predicted MPP superfamily phosphohydrolase
LTVFHTILFAVWTLFHLYIFWRASSLPIARRHISRLHLFIITVALWTTYFLPGIFSDIGVSFLSQPFELFSMNWLGTTFLIFTCLLIVDLVTIFGFLLKRYLTFLRATAFIAGILLSIFALYQGYRAPVVRDYEIRLSKLPSQYDGLVLVAVSDLHVGTFLNEKWLEARVNQVNALQPDVVVLLGDIFEGDSQGERKISMMHLFQEISAPLGVWGVTGNHESHGGFDPTIQFLEESGVQMLRNRWIELEPGLVLAGIDDHHDHSQTPDTTGRIGRSLSGRPSSCATIFLSHRPQRADEVAIAGVGLMLSGHTHGGQLWPFSYISGMVNPLLAGKYIINGMPVIVSRGTGTWGPRMRLWYPGEILRIVLRSK